MDIFGNAKKLGFGLMRLPLLDSEDPASIDIEEFKRMVDLFIERGFTYFDTAIMYCGMKCQNAVKEALTARYPRDRFTLATKLHCGFFHSLKERDEVFENQLESTGVEFFDYYLIHDVNSDHYPIYERFDCFNWLRDKKEKGLVKHMGFSFHDNAETLDRILTEHPEVEFVQLQLNYLDWENPIVQSRKCYETCLRHGKPVIVMEPVRGGSLANVPDSVSELFHKANPEASVPSWAIRFAASHDNVKMVLSGMSNMAQMEDNTSYMQHFKPLSDQENKVIQQALDLLRDTQEIPCTACGYCTGGCPRKIPIPQYFSIYNMLKLREKEGASTWMPKVLYSRLAAQATTPDKCVKCRQCEHICPQHLNITELLEIVAKSCAE